MADDEPRVEYRDVLFLIDQATESVLAIHEQDECCGGDGTSWWPSGCGESTCGCPTGATMADRRKLIAWCQQIAAEIPALAEPFGEMEQALTDLGTALVRIRLAVPAEPHESARPAFEKIERIAQEALRG